MRLAQPGLRPGLVALRGVDLVPLVLESGLGERRRAAQPLEPAQLVAGLRQPCPGRDQRAFVRHHFPGSELALPAQGVPHEDREHVALPDPVADMDVDPSHRPRDPCRHHAGLARHHAPEHGHGLGHRDDRDLIRLDPCRTAPAALAAGLLLAAAPGGRILAAAPLLLRLLSLIPILGDRRRHHPCERKTEYERHGHRGGRHDPAPRKAAQGAEEAARIQRHPAIPMLFQGSC